MRPPPTPADLSPHLPWERGADLELAFAQLWISGPDPSVDGLVRIEALRRNAQGDFDRFERWSNPFPSRAEPAASARMVHEFGVESSDLERASSGAEVWAEFADFVGERALVVLDAEMFGAWAAHFEGRGEKDRCVLGLSEFAAQWMPGRPGVSRENLVRQLLGSVRARTPPGAISARDLQSALAELIARVLELDPLALRLAAAVCICLLQRLREVDVHAARRFELSLSLIERPSRFLSGSTRLFDAQRAPRDGGFGMGLEADELSDPAEAARLWIDELEPAWSQASDARESSVPITTDDEKPFEARDLELVDDIFQVHLPAISAEDGEVLRYRAGQHEVARQTAQTLGSNELLLVHAPTGTGKTLAYLVPAMIWAVRHGVRVGVTTYTRALQEQAMDREVPRALRAIDRATALGPNRLPCVPRVALLKGRANYLCWRALKLHLPGAEDGHEAWLAWLSLFLFSLSDDSGDLDRLAMRAAFGVGSRERESRELESLVRQTRGQVGCCQQRDDRRTCGAEVARARSEQAHVVIANHAFALVKQASFKHVIFDECEHLHDQAHGTWSHALSIEEMRQLFARVRQDGKQASRAPLDRLERAAFPGSQAATALEGAASACRDSLAALDELEREVAAFLAWRTAKERTRDARDQHA
ncbi:MAG: DEAD/DEAH box helicase, partial [Planctomycetota bacterium]